MTVRSRSDMGEVGGREDDVLTDPSIVVDRIEVSLSRVGQHDHYCTRFAQNVFAARQRRHDPAARAASQDGLALQEPPASADGFALADMDVAGHSDAFNE